jgi:hypothetical protein
MTLWETRDFPVLDYMVEHPSSGGLFTQSRSDQPQDGLPALTEAEFHRAVLTLGDAGYLSWTSTELDGGGGCFFQDIFVTGAGKQALGLWPLFDVLGSPAALAGILDQLGVEAAAADERSALSRAAELVRDLAPNAMRALLLGALREAARQNLGV